MKTRITHNFNCDIATEGEFDNGCLPQATNIPLAVLPLAAHRYIEKNKPVFAYCHTGCRAINAEKILVSMEFTDTANIGGVDHYQHSHQASVH